MSQHPEVPMSSESTTDLYPDATQAIILRGFPRRPRLVSILQMIKTGKISDIWRVSYSTIENEKVHCARVTFVEKTAAIAFLIQLVSNPPTILGETITGSFGRLNREVKDIQGVTRLLAVAIPLPEKCGVNTYQNEPPMIVEVDGKEITDGHLAKFCSGEEADFLHQIGFSEICGKPIQIFRKFKGLSTHIRLLLEFASIEDAIATQDRIALNVAWKDANHLFLNKDTCAP